MGYLARPNLLAFAPKPIESVFAGPAELEVLPQQDMWALDGPLIYQSRESGTITIPKGTLTDLASVPKFLGVVPFLDVNGNSRMAGVLHDGIYKLGRSKGKDFADSILHEALVDSGFSAIEAAVYYDAVHWFGVGAWNADGRNVNYGATAANFDSQDNYGAWVKAGATIYS